MQVFLHIILALFSCKNEFRVKRRLAWTSLRTMDVALEKVKIRQPKQAVRDIFSRAEVDKDYQKIVVYFG